MSASTHELLVPTFATRHVIAALRHFEGMAEDFQKGEWEDAIAKAGKFIEAAIKALYVRATGNPPAKGKHFKVDAVINALGALSAPVDDSIRLTIPRACRFVYEVSSNRGGRHDPDEVDPNEMDANAVVTQCSWILAEMIRHAQHGSAGMEEAKQAVDAVMRRRYPLIEEIDGHTYFHGRDPSAVDVALVILLKNYPRRLSPESLIAQLRSNKFTQDNSKKAISRIDRYIHHDASGNLLLLQPGLLKAEELMREAAIAR